GRQQARLGPPPQAAPAGMRGVHPHQQEQRRRRGIGFEQTLEHARKVSGNPPVCNFSLTYITVQCIKLPCLPKTWSPPPRNRCCSPFSPGAKVTATRSSRRCAR